MDRITFQPIGTIFTPFPEPEGTPIQPGAAQGVAGRVQVFPEFAGGLKDLEGFSHLLLFYYFHLSRDFALKVKPFLDDAERGVFATRAPARPNPLGLSLVRLTKLEGAMLHVLDVDMVNGTPLLDIKPFVPEFDCRAEARIGWLAGKLNRLAGARDDGRFRR
jgi:tRNA-Thr(GGU) m(6)t(6)A37 methyltransferase TsaA